ncbi:unnamed protein product [Blepharisma stoltei]|uniref:RanBP2-type domain-containing protein n=1 Tax=Blepharisma stoltei TaxID=1481888 RepID=A0AAU9JPN3_9CILI|nr:unnamed protein product [Blepharisma stoltei]
MSRVVTLKNSRTQAHSRNEETKQAQTKTKSAKSKQKSQQKAGNRPNTIGDDTDGRWRCEGCTFLNSGDICTRCGWKHNESKIDQ